MFPLQPIKLAHKFNFFPPTVLLTESLNKEGVNVYTDGSKVDKNVGSGWAICRDRVCIRYGYCKLPDHASVYEAELLAIYKALFDVRDIIAEGKMVESELNFHVDSQAALLTLKKHKVTGELCVRIVQEVESFRNDTGIELTFHWIKGHNDHSGNEYADYLAKKGGDTGNLFYVSPSLTHIKSQLSLRIEREWCREWSSLRGCRQSKELISFKPSKKEASYVLRRGAHFCKKIIGLLTGHNNMRYHTSKRLFQTNRNFSSNCRFCEEDPETSWHLLYDCPSLEVLRREYMFSPDNPKTGPDIAWYEKLAVKLGIWSIVLQRSDLPEND